MSLLPILRYPDLRLHKVEALIERANKSSVGEIVGIAVERVPRLEIAGAEPVQPQALRLEDGSILGGASHLLD